MGMPWIVMDAAPGGAHTAPSVTGWKAVVLGAVGEGRTVLCGVVTTVWGAVVATLVGAVLAVAGRVVAVVVVVLAAATDDEDADLAPFEPVEQPDATNARTIATRKAHVPAADLNGVRPIFMARHRTQLKASPLAEDSNSAQGRTRGSTCMVSSPRFLGSKPSR
jgi:hypothetical protein